MRAVSPGALVARAGAAGLEGRLLMLAREEAAIRRDPPVRTTELLQTLFGSQGPRRSLTGKRVRVLGN
jgi:hypothetical protein